jgi:hypothetical protein
MRIQEFIKHSVLQVSEPFEARPPFTFSRNSPRLRLFSWVEKRSTRLPFSAFDRSFKCMGGLTIRQDHNAVGKVFVKVPANKSIHLMAA